MIDAILRGKCSEAEMLAIIFKYAFEESSLTILPSIKDEKWQIIHPNLTTPLKHRPTMPLTTLQKQWLKAISLDYRVQLFAIHFEGLDEVEPLFTPSDYYIYDKYSHGDPYQDEDYIRRFRDILRSIREKKQLELRIRNGKDECIYAKCVPLGLEYSEKEDKFWVEFMHHQSIKKVSLANITHCLSQTEEALIDSVCNPIQHKALTLKIVDERNALERVMLHFAHFEKRAEKLDKKHYLVKIHYDPFDEEEIITRILSFGPYIEVVEPPSFKAILIETLKKQRNCGLK